jgi:protein-L-isoaspartate(D-aspartate) O-methyltransferase
MSGRRAKFLLLAVFCLGAAASESLSAPSLRNWKQLASQMADDEIVAAGVKNERVIRAVRGTPRHEFVPANQRQYAYFDMALPIGEGQTISPPFIVASMTEAIDPQPNDRVLEIGTGSGYQAAILSPLVQDVYTIEIVEPLARRAARVLKRLDYANVHTRTGDGYLGWPEAAPFDKIIVTCSPEKVPQPLVDQLRDGGLLVIPVGERYQQTLYLMRKEGDELKEEVLRPTLFVPMTGKAESQREVKPDPKNPQLVNGSFEELLDSETGAQEPAGWHYQRQMTIAPNADAPDGNFVATFRNEVAGLGAQALQGFAVDGREVSRIRLTFSAKGGNIRPGSQGDGWPRMVFTFYDEKRATVGHESVGPFVGSFDWQQQTTDIRVPMQAREAIIRIGLLGAVGELSFDDLKLHVVQ